MKKRKVPTKEIHGFAYIYNFRLRNFQSLLPTPLYLLLYDFLGGPHYLMLCVNPYMKVA